MEETILVCVTVQKECQRLILAGKRLADSARLPLRVLHVAVPDAVPLGSPDTQEALNFLYALSREAGAEMTLLYSADVRQAIVNYAHQVHAVCVVVGSDRHGGWAMAEALEELLDDNITIMRA
ncbi:MAG: universal stress protein [Clostridia bacterium]|nr:universal stress protein [Clostridia bacterium]